MTPLIFFHGAHRWSGPPRIQAAPSKAMEHGPGFYLTSDERTARAYAKGGGITLRFEIDPHIRLLQDARLNVGDMLDFARTTPRIKSRKGLIADLLDAHARALANGKSTVPASTLVNLLHYYKSLTGDIGPGLAHFYVAHGLDTPRRRRGQRAHRRPQEEARQWFMRLAPHPADNPLMKIFYDTPHPVTAAEVRRPIRIAPAVEQRCQGCGALSFVRSIDVAVPERTYADRGGTRDVTGRAEHKHTVAAGWAPLVLLCDECWAWVAEQVVPP